MSIGNIFTAILTIVFLGWHANTFADTQLTADLIVDASQGSGDTGSREQAVRALASVSLAYQSASWSGLLNVQAFNGNDGSRISDDAQGISNIDAEDFARLYEAWINWQQQDFEIRCGKVDANTLFATMEAAGDFISPSAGITPTVSAMPTYPEPALSCNLLFAPNLGFGFRTGIFAGDSDTDFSHQFRIAELQYLQPRVQLQAGAWQHTALNYTGNHDIGGWYGNVQIAAGEQTQLIATTSQGYDSEANIEQHHMLGIVRQNLGPGDFGVLASHVNLRSGRNETGYEVYYRFYAREYWRLQPVWQTIQHPNGDARTVQIFTLRMVLSI